MERPNVGDQDENGNIFCRPMTNEEYAALLETGWLPDLPQEETPTQ